MSTAKKPTTKLITKISITETLQSIPKGGHIEVLFNQIKPSTLRSAVYRLNSLGHYKFKSTERGLTDRCIVTRLK